MNDKINEAIKNGLRDKQIMVAVIPNAVYSDSIKELVLVLSLSYKSVCYVSLNKPASLLLKTFDEYKIDTRKLIFTDGVSNITSKAGKVKIYYVSSPSAFTELSIAINKILDSGNIDTLFFDSLSTLLTYQEPMTTIRFTQDIISKLRAANTKGVFAILAEDSKTELMKDLGMFVDKVISIKVE